MTVATLYFNERSDLRLSEQLNLSHMYSRWRPVKDGCVFCYWFFATAAKLELYKYDKQTQEPGLNNVRVCP